MCGAPPGGTSTGDGPGLVPAATLTYGELARLFTAGYEGYALPLHVDEAALRFMVESWDIDLRRSVVAPDAGIALLGVRGESAWVGGLGVARPSRRRGLGRLLMEALLADAPPTVRLEVLEENEPAIRLYESLGFRHVRLLEVWSLSREVEPVQAQGAPPRPLCQVGSPVAASGRVAAAELRAARDRRRRDPDPRPRLAGRRPAASCRARRRGEDADRRGSRARRVAALRQRSGGRPGVARAHRPRRRARAAPARARALPLTDGPGVTSWCRTVGRRRSARSSRRDRRRCRG